MCAYIFFAQSLLKKKGSVRKEVMNLSFYHRHKNNIPKHESKQHFHLIGSLTFSLNWLIPH